MIKVMLDAGHGGKDPGAVGNGLEEKVLTLKIAQYAKTYLLDHYEVQVGMTREDDRFIELQERANIANRFGADLFVSIHINVGGGTGFETFIYGQASQNSVTLQNNLHSKILEAMRAYGQTVDRGKKRANYAVLRMTNMPAVLTENLFIDSNDAQKLKQEKFLQSVGEGHARGIAQFLGLKSKTPVNIVLDGKRYRLKTGTFASEAEAKRLAAEIKEVYGWQVVNVFPEGGRFFIQTGTFENKAIAETLAAKLRENYDWIVHVIPG